MIAVLTNDSSLEKTLNSFKGGAWRKKLYYEFMSACSLSYCNISPISLQNMAQGTPF